MQSTLEVHPILGDKIKAFNWRSDTMPSRFEWIDKNEILVDHSYQREQSQWKARDIAREWDWPSFGAVSVAARKGKFYAVDGATRLAAAMLRSDVTVVPCMVFDSNDVQHEAQVFVTTNAKRTPVTSVEKYHAGVKAKYELYIRLDAVITDLGLRVAKAHAVDTLQAVGSIVDIARYDPEGAEAVLRLVRALSKAEGEIITKPMIRALNHIQKRGGFDDERLVQRLWKSGYSMLSLAAKKSATIAGKGNAETWAAGIMDEINKGLRHKIQLNSKRGD